MSKITENKWVIGIGVIVVVVVVAVFLSREFSGGNPEEQKSPEVTPVNKIENFTPGQVPKKFPTEVPIEKNTKAVISYNATSPQGKLQATQVFQSPKSVEANFKFYVDYLTKNKWSIIAKDSSKQNFQLIVARNQTGILNVSIHRASDPSKSVVDLSFLPKS